MDNTPHTPTPFKNALEKYGPLKPLVRGGVGGRACGLGSSSSHRAFSLRDLRRFSQQPREAAGILIL